MDNPYATPTTTAAVPQSSQEVSAAVIAPLAATKGWARFLAVLGFIGCGLMLLAGLGMMVAGAAMSNATQSGMTLIPAAVLGVIYLLMAALYLLPTIKLNSYASKIGALLRTPTEASLITALDGQRSFWKVLGVYAIVTIAIYLVIFVIGIVAAMSAGSALSR